MRTKITTAALGGLLAILAFSACSMGGNATGEAAPPANTAEPAAGDSGFSAFGETWEYEDGLAVSVAAPEPYTPGQYAAGADQANNIKLTFTVTNGTDEVFDLAALPDVTSGGVAGQSITDMEDPTVMSFGGTASVLPGQSFSWAEAFSISDPADLTVAISPAPFAYDKAIFTNAQ